MPTGREYSLIFNPVDPGAELRLHGETQPELALDVEETIRCSACGTQTPVSHMCLDCSSCDDCVRSGHRHCDNCGVAVGRWTVTCDGCTSDDAIEDEDNKTIQDYGSSDYPKAIPAKPPYKPFLYMGVELEVECPDNDPEEVATRIAKGHRHQILFKHDGSLNNGFEMVTGKLSLEEHKKLWPEVTSTAIRYGARSWKHKTTGLHVHVSRDWFTALTIGKVLVFVNSDRPSIRRNIVRLAGRLSPDYAVIKKKKLTDGHKGADKYEAVNLEPYHTLEFRLFKGTLNAKRILAMIEFCHAVAYYVKDASIQDFESWASFLNFVTQYPALYSNLLAFFKSNPDTVEVTNGQVAGEE